MTFYFCIPVTYDENDIFLDASSRSVPAVMDLTEAWPRAATPHLRSEVTAGRSYPTSEARAAPEAKAATRRSNPTPKKWWLCGHRRA